MKILIFFFTFISLLFCLTAKAEIPSSVSYSQDKEHFLIKTIVYKKVSYIDSVVRGITYKSTQIYESVEELSKLPEELQYYSNNTFDHLIKNQKEAVIHLNNPSFLWGLFKSKVKVFSFEKDHFVESTKIINFTEHAKNEDSRNSIFQVFFSVIFSGFLGFLVFSLQEYFSLKKLSKDTFGEAWPPFILIFGFVWFILSVTIFVFERNNLYFWFNLPNILSNLFWIVIFFFRRKYWKKRLSK